MDYEKLKGIVDFNAIAVDAGCSGNPGAMEYQGVYLDNVLSSTYTPGSVFKLVTAAAAIENIPDIYQRTWYCSGSEEIGGLFGRMWEHYEQTKEAYDRAARRERYAPSMMDIYLRLQNLFDLYTRLNLAYWRRHGDNVPADTDLFRLLEKFTEAEILLSYCGLV